MPGRRRPSAAVPERPGRTRPPQRTASGPGRSWTAAPRRAACPASSPARSRSEEHTSELQSRGHLVCRLLLEKKKIGCYLLEGDIKKCLHLRIDLSFDAL